MFEKFKKLEPICQILMVAMVIIIIIAVFSPRYNERLSAGLNVGAHIGGLKGGFNFESYENGQNASNPAFTMFYAPWCGHCKTTMPEFDELSNIHTGGTTIGKVNCDEQPDVGKKHNIQGYPTIKFFPNGMDDISSAIDYGGDRTAEAMNSFITETRG